MTNVDVTTIWQAAYDTQRGQRRALARSLLGVVFPGRVRSVKRRSITVPPFIVSLPPNRPFNPGYDVDLYISDTRRYGGLEERDIFRSERFLGRLDLRSALVTHTNKT